MEYKTCIKSSLLDEKKCRLPFPVRDIYMPKTNVKIFLQNNFTCTFKSISPGDNTRRVPASIMGWQQAPRASQHALHRPALGVPSPHLDARPLHLAAPDHEDPLGSPRNGVLETLLQPHRLSQYWVRLSIYLLFLLFTLCQIKHLFNKTSNTIIFNRLQKRSVGRFSSFFIWSRL